MVREWLHSRWQENLCSLDFHSHFQLIESHGQKKYLVAIDWKRIRITFAFPFARNGIKDWEFSSAGSEHLPYKQRVGGSNPSTPTFQSSRTRLGYYKSILREFSSAGSEHLPYKQRVGGSNPSTPTLKPQKILGLFYFQRIFAEKDPDFHGFLGPSEKLAFSPVLL